MVLGIGCDIVEIDRIEKSMANKSFLAKYFTEKEAALIKSRGTGRALAAASNFCAKEAVVKALGTGFGDVSPCEIEVLRKESGAPYIALYGNALLEFEKLGASRLSVSLSHSKGLALAFVIVE